jgi:hypothetical protein
VKVREISSVFETFLGADIADLIAGLYLLVDFNVDKFG